MQCYRISLNKLDSGVAQLSVREPEVARFLFKIYYYCCEFILFYFLISIYKNISNYTQFIYEHLDS